MYLPKMILFDYGHTLVHELSYDDLAGARAELAAATDNPLGVTPEMLSRQTQELYGHVIRFAQAHDLEVPSSGFVRAMREINHLSFDRSDADIELLYWDAAAPGVPMPHIEELLTLLYRRGIRTGVVSNLSFSGETLTRRINSVLPTHRFEFILSSCDYGFRKPHRLLFDVALSKAGLSPADVWFCGDTVSADLVGANNVGMFPVWYESELPCAYYPNRHDNAPPFPHLHINNWSEMMEHINRA